MTDRSSTEEMIALVEKIQLRALKSGGFDPNSFAERTDEVEFRPRNIILMRGFTLWLTLTGRWKLDDDIAGIVRYMKYASQESAALSPRKRSEALKYAKPKSQYQRKDDYFFLMEMKAVIVIALQKLQDDNPLKGLIETIERTTLATAPLGRCNADIRMARKSNAYAVVLDDEVGRLASQMGLIYAKLVDESNGKMIMDSRIAVDRLGQFDAPIQSYQSIVRAFVRDGSSRLARPIVPGNKFDTLVSATFAQLAIIFVLAHEYSHAHLGHLNGPMRTTENEVAFAVAEEKEADQLAIQVVKAVCRYWGCDPNLVFPAAAIVLSTYTSVYEALKNSTEPTLSDHDELRLESAIRVHTLHPTPSERLTHLFACDPVGSAWAYHVATRMKEVGTPTIIDGGTHRRWHSLLAAMRDS